MPDIFVWRSVTSLPLSNNARCATLCKFSSVQFSSVTQSCSTLCDPMDCSTPGFPVLQHLPEFAQIHVHWVLMLYNHLTLFSFYHQSFPASASFPMSHIRWPKYWSFRFSISPPREYSGLISFRIDWLDLLAIQGTLKSLLQHHSSKASILQHSAFFMVQLSHPHITAGKKIYLWLDRSLSAE